jgi:YD repeat-containing protein
MLTEKMDENGATTTYNYSSTNNAYCNWAFPTSITEPLNMSHSMTWNCTGGVMTQLKDENGQTTGLSTNYTWNDPYFWRPANVLFPDGGETDWTYNSLTSFKTTTKMNSSQNIVTTQLLDGLGRNKQQQMNSDPEGVVYQDTAYDALGRVYTVSNPYRSTSDPTYGLTTYGYDALNRTTSVTLQDGSVSSASFTFFVRPWSCVSPMKFDWIDILAPPIVALVVSILGLGASRSINVGRPLNPMQRILLFFGFWFVLGMGYSMTAVGAFHLPHWAWIPRP